MKKLIFPALLFSLLSFTVSADTDQYTAEAKQLTGAFVEELQAELGKAMKAGGPITAIDVCSSLAPAIAKKHSDNSGWSIGRTSLKFRNPNNAPDVWESKVLHQLEAQRSKGAPPDSLMYSEIVEVAGERYFRFMKGIVMPPVEKMPCLKCHGETLDTQVADKLNQFYPEDLAKGYKAGQLRGAFTLKKKLQ